MMRWTFTSLCLACRPFSPEYRQEAGTRPAQGRRLRTGAAFSWPGGSTRRTITPFSL